MGLAGRAAARASPLRSRARHRDAIDYHAFKQWVLHAQWSRAREQLAGLGVELMGDLPFGVTADSVDVWTERALFRRDRSLGAPGDQFDEDGQDWMLPAYDWQALARDDYGWMRRRLGYAGALFDRVRVDHLVGLFRSYSRPATGLRDADDKLVPGSFDPPEEAAQRRQGAAVLQAMIEAAGRAGATLVAEDLGCIPDYVPEVMKRLALPGYRVLIWERDDDGFRDPRAYPRRSVACFATHDTAPVAAWWRALADAEREQVRARCRANLSAMSLETESALTRERFTPAVHAALLELIQGAASELTLLLIQDVLGSPARINTPATVGPHNWRYRLPAPVERLREDTSCQAALARCRDAIERAER
ncbi:MAG: 4-alpha-glucanotransferase [Myxococcales bacterium]|nr:4-alpha-glucanotransferase [Myxococcales bacterium]